MNQIIDNCTSYNDADTVQTQIKKFLFDDVHYSLYKLLDKKSSKEAIKYIDQILLIRDVMITFEKIEYCLDWYVTYTLRK